MNFDLINRGEPDRVNTGVVSHNFFDLLGIKPILGRTFVASDDVRDADAVLILSHTYWRTKFGGDPNIVGQVFEMNDRPHRVIGVLPNVPHYPQENDVYMPVLACPFRAARRAADSQQPPRVRRVERVWPPQGRRDARSRRPARSARSATTSRRTAPSSRSIARRRQVSAPPPSRCAKR